MIGIKSTGRILSLDSNLFVLVYYYERFSYMFFESIFHLKRLNLAKRSSHQINYWIARSFELFATNFKGGNVSFLSLFPFTQKEILKKII